MTRTTWLSTLSTIAALAGCDATTVGEPIGAGRGRSEGTGAGGDAGGTTASTSPSTSSGPVEGTIMNQAEAEAWCTTYVYERHPMAEINTPPPAPGQDFYGHSVVWYEGLYCYYSPTPYNSFHILWWPTVEDCVRNILRTPCAATVAELDQCVDGVIAGWEAHNLDPEAPCPTEGSCDAFLAANCDEVVVHRFTDGEGGGFGGLEVE